MKNPLVVGYRGEIGSFILQGLIKYMPSAIPIMCYDKNDSLEEKRERVRKADVIFLCIPFDVAYPLAWYDIFHTELQGKIVIDQTSLKGPLYSHRNFKHFAKDLTLLSMHMLFRPSATPNPRDRTIALIGEPMEWLKVLKDLRDFLEYGLGTQLVYFKTWKAHDEEMALQQAVVHRVILTLGKMVDASPCTTYVGKQICNLRLRIQQGDYGLYKIIQENPYLSEKLCDFGGNLSHFHLEKHMKKCGDK